MTDAPTRARALYRGQFGHDPAGVWFAPGRVVM